MHGFRPFEGASSCVLCSVAFCSPRDFSLVFFLLRWPALPSRSLSLASATTSPPASRSPLETNGGSGSKTRDGGRGTSRASAVCILMTTSPRWRIRKLLRASVSSETKLYSGATS